MFNLLQIINKAGRYGKHYASKIILSLLQIIDKLDHYGILLRLRSARCRVYIRLSNVYVL